MRKNLGVKTFAYPQPVFIIASYDEDNTPDAMNAAWGGISNENEIFLCLSHEHKTADNILKRKCFTVSMATADTVAACDYVGVVSAHKEKNKFEKAGFHAIKSENVDAPIIAELPLTIECKLKSYDPETDHLFGEIVNVCADEKILDKNGKPLPEKFHPITFDPVNHTYIELGKVVGHAFKDGFKIK